MADAEPEQAAVPVDDVHRSIIAELTRGGRSVTPVAENVHISRAHAYSRIARLTGAGVLTKFTALVDLIKALLPHVNRSGNDESLPHVKRSGSGTG